MNDSHSAAEMATGKRLSLSSLKSDRKISLKIVEEEQLLEKSNDGKEQIINAIGGFGKWQLIKCIYITAIIWMPASFHLLNMVFFREKTEFWCAQPKNVNIDNWRNVSSPSGDSCHIYDVDWSQYNGQDLENSTLKNCDSFEYDRSFWRRTIIHEFDLVCDNAYKKKWTQQATFFGLLCGVFASGIISDKIGRLKTMMLMLTMVIVCGTLTSFSPNYPLFLLGIWCNGFSSIGFGTVMYCWMMEILSG